MKLHTDIKFKVHETDVQKDRHGSENRSVSISDLKKFGASDIKGVDNCCRLPVGSTG
jgi:hypothetical protein